MDSDLGYTRTAFKLDVGHIVERLMQALPVIKDLDVFQYGGFGLLSGTEIVEVNEFVLQRAEEALGTGVVVTVAFGGHARTHSMRKRWGKRWGQACVIALFMHICRPDSFLPHLRA